MHQYLNTLNTYLDMLNTLIGQLTFYVPELYLFIILGNALCMLILLILRRKLRPKKQAQSVPVQESESEALEETISVSPIPQVETTPIQKPKNLISRLKDGMSKTRNSLSSGIDKVLQGKNQFTDEVLEELEEVLITSDIGVKATMELIDAISQNKRQIKTIDEFKQILKKELLNRLDFSGHQQNHNATKPFVIMVVGVNGVGKTTTIGKLAAKYNAAGKKVLIGAADTFRAAAGEQLAVWADRSGSQIIKHQDNADPAAVAFDTVEAGIARDVDIILIDTAGRLHTKVNLMEELKKIDRTIAKKMPGAPHETLLVVDATTGQNALSQAKMFHEALELNAIALTKLDGTAKGGIVIGIASEISIPLKYIGVGESIEDLQDFDSEKFVNAIL